MVQELQPNPTTEASFRGAPDACASTPERRVGVFASTCRGPQNVDERVDCFFTLLPEELARLLRP